MWIVHTATVRFRATMIIFAVIVVGILGQRVSSTVKCYTCSSKETEACERPDKSIPIETCNMQTLESTRIWASKIDPRYNNIFEVDRTDAGRIDLMCLKVIARDGNKHYTIRGCQLAEQSHLDICKKLTEKNDELGAMVKTEVCTKCFTDACNYSNSLKFSVPLSCLSLISFICKYYF
nr:unnamed protein product [Callosobruchus chinensis]